jgi:hypothetical protein
VGAVVGHSVGISVPPLGSNVGAVVGVKEYIPEIKLNMGTVGSFVGGGVGTTVGVDVGNAVGTYTVGDGVGTVVGSGAGVGA